MSYDDRIRQNNIPYKLTVGSEYKFPDEVIEYLFPDIVLYLTAGLYCVKYYKSGLLTTYNIRLVNQFRI